MSQRTKRDGPAAPERRRPGARRSRFWSWVERVTPWFGVAVLVLTMIVIGFPTVLYTRDVLAGEQAGSAAILHLVTLYASEVVIALMIVLGVYAAAPRRLRLSPGTVRTLGTVVFVGNFFLILVVLRGEFYAAVPIIIYFVRIRRDLADELPVWAGGRMTPARKEPRRDDVIRRPPRSWDEPGGGQATKRGGASTAKSGGRRRGKKGRRSGGSGNRPRGR